MPPVGIRDRVPKRESLPPLQGLWIGKKHVKIRGDVVETTKSHNYVLFHHKINKDFANKFIKFRM